MTFTIQRTAGESGGHSYFLSTTSTRFTNTDTLAGRLVQSSPLHIASGGDSSREPLVSGHKSQTTKPDNNQFSDLDSNLNFRIQISNHSTWNWNYYQWYIMIKENDFQNLKSAMSGQKISHKIVKIIDCHHFESATLPVGILQIKICVFQIPACKIHTSNAIESKWCQSFPLLMINL